MAVDFFHAEFRKKRAGFPDLLRYDRIMRPGLILGKGGELIATFKYRGPDMQCASKEDLDYLRLRVEAMIRKLGGGWMMHSSTFRRTAIEYDYKGAFPDAVTRAIENERRAMYMKEGSHFENEYYLTFTYLPDVVMVSKVKDFALETNDIAQKNAGLSMFKAIEYFERQVADYVSTIESGINSKLERLSVRKVIEGGSHLPALSGYNPHSG